MALGQAVTSTVKNRAICYFQREVREAEHAEDAVVKWAEIARDGQRSASAA